MSHHMKLREWLVKHQRFCVTCGNPVTVHDTLHHLFIRRMKQYEDLLWTRQNISLVCPQDHTGMGEAPDLNYLCAIQKFRMGITPDEIEAWVKNLPTKVPLALPKFYFRAREDFDKEKEKW